MRIAALVLAAGRSRRFGAENKLLADLDGSPVLARTLDAVTAASFQSILVVTGLDHIALATLLARYPARVIRCPDHDDGMGYSIAAGVAALANDIDGVAILPGDMPLITAPTLCALVDVFERRGGRTIVHAATQDGAQRNPVIWPRALFQQLASLRGDRGAKSLIHDAIAVRTHDDSELIDVDDLAALDRARSILRARNTAS